MVFARALTGERRVSYKMCDSFLFTLMFLSRWPGNGSDVPRAQYDVTIDGDHRELCETCAKQSVIKKLGSGKRKEVETLFRDFDGATLKLDSVAFRYILQGAGCCEGKGHAVVEDADIEESGGLEKGDGDEEEGLDRIDLPATAGVLNEFLRRWATEKGYIELRRKGSPYLEENPQVCALESKLKIYAKRPPMTGFDHKEIWIIEQFFFVHNIPHNNPTVFGRVRALGKSLMKAAGILG